MVQPHHLHDSIEENSIEAKRKKRKNFLKTISSLGEQFAQNRTPPLSLRSNSHATSSVVHYTAINDPASPHNHRRVRLNLKFTTPRQHPSNKIQSCTYTHLVSLENINMCPFDIQHLQVPHQASPPFNSLVPHILPLQPPILHATEPLRVDIVRTPQHDGSEMRLLIWRQRGRVILAKKMCAVLEGA